MLLSYKGMKIQKEHKKLKKSVDCFFQLFPINLEKKIRVAVVTFPYNRAVVVFRYSGLLDKSITGAKHG